MIQKPFDQIAKEEIAAVVENAVREGRTIEYKQQLPSGKDDDKKEFLADVSSFANASGGDLLFGIEESRDGNGKPTGIPAAAPGLSGINADQEIQRLENMLRDGIEPRIPGVRTKVIDGFPDGPVILVRIPQSWASPHMVTFKASPRFFSRSSVGEAPLDVAEIRAAFLQSDSLPEKIRRFREDRLGRIVAGEAPVELYAGAMVVFHVVPVSAFHQAAQLDVVEFADGRRHFAPMGGAGGWNGRLNLEGYVSYTGGDDDANLSRCYSQLFRNGSAEGVEVITYFNKRNRDAPQNAIPSVSLEKHIIGWFGACLKVYGDLGVEAPFTLMLSLLGVKGHCLLVDQFNSSAVMSRDTLVFPELVVDESPISPERALRPLFDLLCQSFGFARSRSYNAQEEWRPW